MLLCVHLQVPELKRKVAALGLEAKGTKAELLARVEKYLQEQEGKGERGRSIQFQNHQFICLLLSEEEEELLEEVEEEEEEELIEGEGEEVDVDGVEGEVAEDSATKENTTVQATTSQPPPPDTNKGYGCLYCIIACVVNLACTIVVREPSLIPSPVLQFFEWAWEQGYM